MKHKLAFIGAGNMTEALVKGLLKSKTCPAGSITVTDTRPERLDFFRGTFGVHAKWQNVEAAANANVIILAVKPQVMAEILSELKGKIAESALVISIAAGITSAQIEAGLGNSVHVVRVMPNTPALVSAGVSAISGGKNATEDDVKLAEKLLGSVGIAVRVDESMMDAVTALSGSGPAYVFYLMEAMLSAAKKLNVDPSVANQIIYRTIEGAARLALESDVGPDELRARVTSKGGTTAAAIETLNAKSVTEAIEEAVLAAHKRSRELSGG